MWIPWIWTLLWVLEFYTHVHSIHYHVLDASLISIEDKDALWASICSCLFQCRWSLTVLEVSPTTSSLWKKWSSFLYYIQKCLRSLRSSLQGVAYCLHDFLSQGFSSFVCNMHHARKRLLKYWLRLTPTIFPPLCRGCLFYGPPGTGKTLVARALANECSQGDRKVSFFMRKGADCLSKWVGESERQLRLLFDQVI